MLEYQIKQGGKKRGLLSGLKLKLANKDTSDKWQYFSKNVSQSHESVFNLEDELDIQVYTNKISLLSIMFIKIFHI